MFRNIAVSSLDVSNFNTSKATNLGQMFCGCSNLTYFAQQFNLFYRAI